MKIHPSGSFYVSENGKIFDLDFNEIVPKLNTNGYLSVKSKNVHVLVAETFLNHDRGGGKVINHKDGNKTNNSIRNLEVVTYSENAVHAYINGLRQDNICVLVKDLRSGEVSKYYSMNECARYFNINTFLVHNALKPKRRGKVWLKYFLIIKDGQEWPEYDPKTIGKSLNGYHKDVLVINVSTKEKEVHRGFSTISKITGMKPNSIRARLQRSIDGKTQIGIYSLKYVEDEDISGIRYVENKITRQVPNRKPKRIMVSRDGKEVIFDSIKTFCDVHNFSYNAVIKAVHKGKHYKQFSIDYI